jgi:phosphoesterase RecJ-like protein
VSVSPEHSDSLSVTHETLDRLPLLARQFRDRLSTATRPVVLAHANADADAVSSALGAALICERLGHPATLVTSGDASLPNNLRFIAGAERVISHDDDLIRQADLLIFVDCSDMSRLGPLYSRLTNELERKRSTVNIDHHVTNARFGELNIVIPQAAATAEIIAGIASELGLELDASEATTLLAGVYGDTLGLRTPSTTPATMRVAATLLEAGANLDAIVDALFRMKPYSTVALWGDALSTAKWSGGLLWTEIDPEMLERVGADRTEAEGLVNFLAGTTGARAAALLYKEPSGWRVSMRSLTQDVNVAEILQHYGGGGHPRAAGAKLPPGTEARDHFLDDIASRVGPRLSTTVLPGGGDDPI